MGDAGWPWNSAKSFCQGSLLNNAISSKQLQMRNACIHLPPPSPATHQLAKPAAVNLTLPLLPLARTASALALADARHAVGGRSLSLCIPAHAMGVKGCVGVDELDFGSMLRE